MSLSKERLLGEAVALRIKTKTNPAIQSDLASAIESVFSKHGIKLDPGLTSELVIAVPDELGGQLSDVVLPGGTNC